MDQPAERVCDSTPRSAIIPRSAIMMNGRAGGRAGN